jgi:hypothetical protein
MKTACECGSIDQWLSDPRVPISKDNNEQVWCNLNETERRPLHFCFFCGGKPAQTPVRNCVCNEFQHWTEVSESRVRFDSALNEFHLSFADDGTIFIYFCPSCGGKLPASRRSHLFVERSPGELEATRKRLDAVRSLTDVLHILGDPDITRRPPPSPDMPLDKVINVAWFYERHTKSFDILVQELANGSLQILFPRKLRSGM